MGIASEAVFSILDVKEADDEAELVFNAVVLLDFFDELADIFFHSSRDSLNLLTIE